MERSTTRPTGSLKSSCLPRKDSRLRTCFPIMTSTLSASRIAVPLERSPARWASERMTRHWSTIFLSSMASWSAAGNGRWTRIGWLWRSVQLLVCRGARSRRFGRRLNGSASSWDCRWSILKRKAAMSAGIPEASTTPWVNTLPFYAPSTWAGPRSSRWQI